MDISNMRKSSNVEMRPALDFQKHGSIPDSIFIKKMKESGKNRRYGMAEDAIDGEDMLFEVYKDEDGEKTNRAYEAKKFAYTKLIMNQLGIDHDFAASIVWQLGVPQIEKLFKSPQETSKIEENLNNLKKMIGE